MTAGEFKRTVSVFGEITERGRKKFQEELEDTHSLFKQFVKAHRPKLDLDQVATGEHWLARRGLELGLVDQLRTSDEYLKGEFPMKQENLARRAAVFASRFGSSCVVLMSQRAQRSSGRVMTAMPFARLPSIARRFSSFCASEARQAGRLNPSESTCAPSDRDVLGSRPG